ncbi:hypothetical protein [Streptomyces sp. TE5632]
MRRGLVHVLAWLLATGAAVTLSWWGVDTVMAGTAYDPPRALPITAADATTQEPRPVSSSTRRPTDAKAPEAADDAADAGDSKDAQDPKDSKSSDNSGNSGNSEDTAADAGGAQDAQDRESSGRSADGPGEGSPDPAPDAAAPAPATSGEVKAYDTEGGRAVFDLGETSASLVSATPGAGWSMQVWKTEAWIRVDFAADADRVSVFCTWHDGPPRVEVNTY